MPKRNETLRFNVNFQGTQRATAATTIVDMSYPMTYSTKWSTNSSGTDTVTSVNEGSTVYFIITTDNVPNGTVLGVIIGGGTISGADINNYIYKQDVTINNNKAYLAVSINADQTTEGTETFNGTLVNSAGSVLSTSVMSINDTSKTPAPTYSVDWYSTSSGTTAISTVNEGSTAWLIVNTTNVPNGTVLLTRAIGMLNTDFTDDILDREVTISSNVGRVAFPIKADNVGDGNKTFAAHLYNRDGSGGSKASASITVMDTSKETIVTIPDAYNLKGVNLLPLFQQQIGRNPGANENIRVIVPAHIELNGFPRVIGRKYLRSEKTDLYLDGLGYAYRHVYEDTYWPAQHGISLLGMPNSELITIDVYGKLISGMREIAQSDAPATLYDSTFTPSGLPMDYYSRHSSGYYHALIVGNSPSINYYDFLSLNLPAIDYSTVQYGFAIYSPNGFKLIVRNGGMVLGHGGYKSTVGMEYSYNADWALVPRTGFSAYGGGTDAVMLGDYNSSIKANVMSGGVFAGGGGAGGNGGGLLAGGMTHNGLSLSIYYGAFGPGGAPYGGCGYTFYGSSGDPICPIKYARTTTVRTANRRIGDTGSSGYRSKLSGGSASLTSGGVASNRYTYGSVGQNYFWDFTAGAGGGIGQHGTAGSCPLYGDYRWSPNVKYTYNAAERTAAGLPGMAGNASSYAITYDTSIT